MLLEPKLLDVLNKVHTSTTLSQIVKIFTRKVLKWTEVCFGVHYICAQLV